MRHRVSCEKLFFFFSSVVKTILFCTLHVYPLGRGVTGWRSEKPDLCVNKVVCCWSRHLSLRTPVSSAKLQFGCDGPVIIKHVHIRSPPFVNVLDLPQMLRRDCSGFSAKQKVNKLRLVLSSAEATNCTKQTQWPSAYSVALRIGAYGNEMMALYSLFISMLNDLCAHGFRGQERIADQSHRTNSVIFSIKTNLGTRDLTRLCCFGRFLLCSSLEANSAE